MLEYLFNKVAGLAEHLRWLLLKMGKKLEFEEMYLALKISKPYNSEIGNRSTFVS